MSAQERAQMRRYLPSLSAQAARFEQNYAMLQKLCGSIEQGRLRIRTQSSQGHEVVLTFEVLECHRYTRTLSFKVQFAHLPAPLGQSELWLRLYDDVGSAEVVTTQQAKQLQPFYCYPNEKMLQTDEKIQLNLFLSQWLQYCLKQGLTREYQAEPSSGHPPI